MNIQQPLQNEFVKLIPLQPIHFEQLYQVANDKLLWEQHPNPDRYKREVFEVYFKGAIQSGGAYLVLDAATKAPIGCTRYYDYLPEEKRITIGYSFISRANWGKLYNKSMKLLMVNYALQFVESIHFHVGASNIRSQKAMEKIGAKKIAELEVAYFGETKKLNFVYEISSPLTL
jgi:RimJ/RimL family protein N-acetyltransferase